MNISIASDHAGFKLKQAIFSFLNASIGPSTHIRDEGPQNDEAVDYPDFAKKVAEKVSNGTCSRGILICGSGIGMSIVANKYPGIRAALCLDTDTAMMSRRHNDSNILVLAGRKTGNKAAKEIINIWLNTPFDGGRHQRRIDKITLIENQFLKK